MRILALVMAGGEGNRLELLTEERAKPVVPYAGVYRLIDFPLSNCVHSGISDVWLVEQYRSHSLNEYVANGRPWDLDRTHGGLRLLPPYLGGEESGWHGGNADAVYRNRNLIRDFHPDVVLMLSADHVYKLDYGEMVRSHLERGAALTMGTAQVPLEEAGRFGTVSTNDGRVTRFVYKPEHPTSGVVTTEVFVFDPARLLAKLEEFGPAQGVGDQETSLKDFGDELLPALVDEGRVYEYRHRGYWRDVGTVDSYWRSHMDLLVPEPELDLDDPLWPIFTLSPHRTAAYVEPSARIENSLISPGCTVRGRVVNSVLAPGVLVDQGAVVRDSIVLHEVVVGPGAKVETAILDMHVRVERGAAIGRTLDPEARSEERVVPQITLVGRRTRILSESSVEPSG